MVLSKNEFGTLVKAYRKQRGWTQEELAERWGHSRGYIAQIEGGKRKVESTSQLVRLADLLDIPEERLEAIGRGIPERRQKTAARHSQSKENAMLDMLLAPGRDMVRLSYLIWQADQHPMFEENLRNLVFHLDQALSAYRGEFRQPAQQLLAYAHQMQGKMAFDRLDLAAAGGHFAEMIELGQELHDPDIIAAGMAHQGSLLRKRGRYEQAIRCFEAARPFADMASQHVQGMRFMLLARGFYDSGHEQGFVRAINSALEIATDLKENISSLANEFSLDDVLCEQASGLTELGQPEKALVIYQETDRLRPSRLLREQGSYIINKAQAYLQLLDLDEGIAYSLQGIHLASSYRSKRHIGWLEKSYQRALQSPVKADKRLHTLRDALRETRQHQEVW